MYEYCPCVDQQTIPDPENELAHVDTMECSNIP